MKPRSSFAGTVVLAIAIASAISISAPAAQGHPQFGHLTVQRTPNFGWNLAFHLQIDGHPVATVVQGQRFDAWLPSGRHVLTVSKVPFVAYGEPTSTVVNIQPGWNYVFTAMWDSNLVYLHRFAALSPGEVWQLRP